jgi:Zn-dependent metalloprotease
MASVPCPLYCIIGSNVFDRLARVGTALQRSRALATLRQDTDFRLNRELQAGARRPFRAARRWERQLQGKPWWAIGTTTPRRTVYTAQNGYRVPGVKARSEGDPPTGNAPVDEVYDALGATFDLYATEYGRDSLDDEGMELKATTHYGDEYDNAYWSGLSMVYGDGDAPVVPPGGLPAATDIFNRFTIDIVVTGHELTHGVTQYESGLLYRGQSGALNESLSDVFGVLVKQRQLGQVVTAADWLIGAGLLIPLVAPPPGVHRTALRSMKDPGNAYNDPGGLGKDPQPKHMDDYDQTDSDSGGVHINSGIPNHAFYLAAMQIGGHAWEKTGLIWYAAATSPRLRPTAQFRDFARLTLWTALLLYGVNSSERQAVGDAWDQVGIVVP